MSDLISRQAILKHIEKIRHGVQMMDDTHRAGIIMNGMYLCEKAVRNQPSAQPENIRCYECKHGTHSRCGNVYICNVSPELVSEHKADFYCGYAKRKTDGEVD